MKTLKCELFKTSSEGYGGYDLKHFVNENNITKKDIVAITTDNGNFWLFYYSYD